MRRTLKVRRTYLEAENIMTGKQIEVHDPAILAQARAVLDACRSPKEMQEPLSRRLQVFRSCFR